MNTTIQITVQLKKLLDQFKLSERDTYNDVIEMLVEDEMELSEETKREIQAARKEIKEGKYVSHEELKRRLGL
jgi:predicted transcriptional regulator